MSAGTYTRDYTAVKNTVILKLISHPVWNRVEKLKFSGNPFTIDEPGDKLKGREEKPTLLIDYLKN